MRDNFRGAVILAAMINEKRAVMNFDSNRIHIKDLGQEDPVLDTFKQYKVLCRSTLHIKARPLTQRDLGKYTPPLCQFCLREISRGSVEVSVAIDDPISGPVAQR
jgi:hypothetical protein